MTAPKEIWVNIYNELKPDSWDIHSTESSAVVNSIGAPTHKYLHESILPTPSKELISAEDVFDLRIKLRNEYFNKTGDRFDFNVLKYADWLEKYASQPHPVSKSEGTPAVTEAVELNQSPIKIKYMNFGQAIEALKEGKSVSRNGWNGKGMFIYLNKGSYDYHSKDGKTVDIVSEIEGVSVTLFEGGDEGTVTRLPNLNMKAATGSTVTGWLASQTDLLAEDWGIVD